MMSKAILRASEKGYQLLLYLYPKEHQRLYGKYMRQTFHDLINAAHVQAGSIGLIRLWGETLSDFVSSVMIEYWDVIRRGTMSRKTILAVCLTLIFSFITGYVNINATEVQAPMACILLFAFLAGVIQPKAAWRWAVLIGLSIPISTFVGLAINFNFPDPPPRFPITLAVLVIPALVAAYAGVLAYRVTNSSTNQASV